MALLVMEAAWRSSTGSDDGKDMALHRAGSWTCVHHKAFIVHERLLKMCIVEAKAGKAGGHVDSERKKHFFVLQHPALLLSVHVMGGRLFEVLHGIASVCAE